MKWETIDLIEAIRNDIESNLEEKILQKLESTITKTLYANIFTVKEAAKYLKVSTQTIRNKAKCNQLTYFKQRGQYYFRQQDLEHYIEGRLVRAYKTCEKK